MFRKLNFTTINKTASTLIFVDDDISKIMTNALTTEYST